MRTTLEGEVCFTGVVTEARVSESSGQDAGEAGDSRSDPPVDVVMVMTTAVTPTHTDTAGTTMFELMERNENGKQGRRSEAPATPSYRRSRMERTIRHQAQELMQLHRTVGHLTNLVQAQAAREEAHWLGMRKWMQEREQKWDAHHEDDKVWGAGVTNIIVKVLKRVAPGQEARERESDESTRMDGRGLEASQHADTRQEGGPEMCQQLQQQPKPRLPLKVEPKPQQEPKPNSAPTPARRWETVPPRIQRQRAPIGAGGLSTTARPVIFRREESVPLPGPPPTSGSSMADTGLNSRRDESIPLPRKMDDEITSAVNRALFQHQAPAHVRIMKV